MGSLLMGVRVEPGGRHAPGRGRRANVYTVPPGATAAREAPTGGVSNAALDGVATHGASRYTDRSRIAHAYAKNN
ncbi:hypothetical protein [Halorarum salinum]|uniref:Uncharacterized protein n=1 Tax=Halorarum salinum TaxID=2743089 RepID=A0A7D5QIU2_9EURY|nr:hypothetical protein [Halobaculum salinum]QLG60945.1 hypothetical protein HUG12_03985 [Halobaculum salinum]